MKPGIDISPFELIIFDADDTLRECTVFTKKGARQPCPNRDGEWQLMRNVRDVFQDLSEECKTRKLRFGIASNQGGVSFGFVSQGDAIGMLRDTLSAAFDYNPPQGKVLVRMCPGMEEDDPMRKPNPGMLTELMDYFRIPPGRTLMVGNHASDMEAAGHAGAHFCFADTFFNRK
jgi:D-glycero-D-manno-heptose 1,7-bisphosphate phosphatase